MKTGIGHTTTTGRALGQKQPQELRKKGTSVLEMYSEWKH